VRALITGGARGLGEAIAAQLVSDSWSLALFDTAPAVSQPAERLAPLRADATEPAAHYNASKAGIVSLTLQLAVEWAPR